MSNKTTRPVVVSTAHRGIFVGYTSDSGDGDAIELTQARMVVYYGAETRSFMGLAVRGPLGAKVSPAVIRIKLRNVTAVVDASPEAVVAWEKEPWN